MPTLPAVSIEIPPGRDTIVRAGYGLPTSSNRWVPAPSTLYQIGSIHKTVSRRLPVMRLVETGRINLDDSISGYISGPADRLAAVSVRPSQSHLRHSPA